MSAMMDFVASAIVFGILALAVGRVQTNIDSTLYQNTDYMLVQGNAVQLASQLEHDILKAGYGVSGQAVSSAGSRTLTFLSDLTNTSTVTTVAYSIGDSTMLSSTANVHDFPLFRTEGGVRVQQNWGLISFRFSYYDSTMDRLDTPLDSTDRAAIRAIRASFTIQSPEPVYSGYDTTWPAVTWQKLMYPRNLNNLQ